MSAAPARGALRALARGPARAAYRASGPVVRSLARSDAGRRSIELVLRAGGHALLWAFEARPQPSADGVRREWVRVLRGVGLQPTDAADGCGVCFARCQLDLGPGEERTCEAVMSINDEMVRALGGRLVPVERLVDPGGRQCRMRVEGDAPESETWCDTVEARRHFDGIADRYDWIMGLYEVPANRRAVKGLRLPAGAHVLDLGVGTGLGLRVLLERLAPDARVTAVDSSLAMIERTRRRLVRDGLADRVALLHGDARAVPLPDRSVDLVYASFLLDLLDRPARADVLAETQRLLKPGGRALFVVMDAEPASPMDRALTALYRAGYRRWNPLWMALLDGYAPHCRPVQLRRSLLEAGLRVVRRDRAHVTVFPVAIYEVRRIG